VSLTRRINLPVHRIASIIRRIVISGDDSIILRFRTGMRKDAAGPRIRCVSGGWRPPRRDWPPVDLDPGDICCESGISTGGVGTTTAFLDFPSEAKCQAAVAALAGADQINPSRGNHPNISPSATYRILCPLRRALKAKRYPAPAAWSLQRSGRASACLSAGRLSDGSSPADADICGIREA